MARRYHVSPLPPAGTCRLPPDVAHHLARVMRARAGEAIILFDGAGRECHGQILEVHAHAPRPGGSRAQPHRIPVVEVRLGEPIRSQREPGVEVEVAFALPTGQRSEWLFEHGTEIGIRRFRPLVCARSLVGAGGDRATRRHQRWQRICAAAAGQCDRSMVPEVAPLEPLDKILGSGPMLPRERYLAHASGPALGAAASDHVLLLVGPAGGFTAGEIEAAGAAGFEPRSLGPLTLRTETAVIAGAVRLLAGR